MLPAVLAYYKPSKSATKRSTRWLLQQIQEALGHHLKSVCKHKKYGTILYRAGGDLLQALSVALGSICTSSDEQGTVSTSPKITFEEAVELVGEEMNNKLHKLAAELMSQEEYDYRFDQIIKSVDSQLWKLMTMMTAPRKTLKNPQTLNVHIKKIRQFYCLCTLLFCTNNRCCMPVHVLLTDVIKAGGGSSETVKIFNRFGAVASEDTHSRLVSYVSTKRPDEIKLEMTPHAFQLASLDNMDVLLSHASAYAGKPSNIWHDTSIQCVEPKPKSLLHTSKTYKKQKGASEALLPQTGTCPSPFEASLPLPHTGTSSSQLDAFFLCTGMSPSSLSASQGPLSLTESQGPLSLTELQQSPLSLTELRQGPLSFTESRKGPLSLTESQDPLSLTESQGPLSLTELQQSPLSLTELRQGPLSFTESRQCPLSLTESRGPKRHMTSPKSQTTSNRPKRRKRTLIENTDKATLNTRKYSVKSVCSNWEPPVHYGLQHQRF